MTVFDFITAARYTKAFAHGATLGTLKAAAFRALQDHCDWDLWGELEDLHDERTAPCLEAASDCPTYDRGFTAGYVTAFEHFNRPMTKAQIADCVATVNNNLAQQAA